MPAIETYLVTHTFTTRVGASSPEDAIRRAHAEITRNEQEVYSLHRSTTLYDAPKVVGAEALDEAAGLRAARIREHWVSGPGSKGNPDWAPQNPVESDPEPSPLLVDRDALIAVSQHVTKIAQGMASALAQVKMPEVVFTLTPEAQASVDALRDAVTESLRVTRKGPTSPRQD